MICERASICLVLSGMRQRSRVFEHLAEVSTINPAIAVWALNEMLSRILRLFAQARADDFAASDGHAADNRCRLRTPVGRYLPRLKPLRVCCTAASFEPFVTTVTAAGTGLREGRPSAEWSADVSERQEHEHDREE